MVTQDRANYVAGLMDGEGSIMLICNGNNEHKHPTIQITTTTPEIFEGLVEDFGGTMHHRGNIIDWQLRGADKCIDFLKQILPFMKLKKKKARGQYILDYYKAVTPRNGRYTNEILEKKKLFESNFSLLTGEETDIQYSL